MGLADVESVRFLVGEGFDAAGIAGVTGLDVADVEVVLAGGDPVVQVRPVLEEQVPAVRRGPGRPSTVSREQAERARVLRAQGWSLARIGEALGVSKQAVWRVTADQSRPAATSAPERVTSAAQPRERRPPLLRDEELFGPGEWAVGGGVGWSIAPF